jgi:putative DNA primase/helicase
LRFAAQAQGRFVFDHTLQLWYIWDGSHWTMDKTGAAFDAVRAFVRLERKRAQVDAKTARAMGSLAFARAIEALAKNDQRISVHQERWDVNPWLLGVPGGVVDLRTGVLRQARPEDYISRQTTVMPAPPGAIPVGWLKFLEEATGGDADLQAFLQRWLGYCLTGDVREESLVFLYGSGGNGKGTLISTVVAILGPYAISQPIEAFTAGGRLNGEYYRAQMAGARLVTASETESGRSWAESQIKELTGNEAPVSARHPNGRPFDYQPQFKLQFVGNHAPNLKDRSPAMERRLRIVPFPHTPAQPDRGLKERLRSEMPAILRWMIDGCLAWQRDGLGTAVSIQQASGEYFERQDAYGRWMRERCIVSPELQTRPGQLLADYRSWCTTNQVAALTAPEFAEKRSHTEGLTHKTIDGTRWVVGIGLRPEARNCDDVDDTNSF